eukprot:1178435-Prorocentrum_minimum.AAC.2
MARSFRVLSTTQCASCGLSFKTPPRRYQGAIEAVVGSASAQFGFWFRRYDECEIGPYSCMVKLSNQWVCSRLIRTAQADWAVLKQASPETAKELEGKRDELVALAILGEDGNHNPLQRVHHRIPQRHKEPPLGLGRTFDRAPGV